MLVVAGGGGGGGGGLLLFLLAGSYTVLACFGKKNPGYESTVIKSFEIE